MANVRYILEENFTSPYYDINIGDVNIDSLRDHLKMAKSAFSSLEMILERAKPVDDENVDFENSFIFESAIVRAVRAYSTLLKLFIQIDKFQNGVSADQLNKLYEKMELVGIISSPKHWLQMSEIEEQFFTKYDTAQFIEIFRNILKSNYAELKFSINRCEFYISGLNE